MFWELDVKPSKNYRGENKKTLFALSIGVLSVDLRSSHVWPRPQILRLDDNQLRDFRRRPNPGPEDILDSGLWGVVRYPNYLGEMLFWWSMALCGLGAGGSWVVCLGAVAMMLMFVLASIPMKEKRMLARRLDYPAYQQRVPLLIPRLW